MSGEDSARYEESWRVEDVEVCCCVAVQWRNEERINLKCKKWLRFCKKKKKKKKKVLQNIIIVIMVSLLAMFENSRLNKVVCYKKEEEFHLREMDVFN